MTGRAHSRLVLHALTPVLVAALTLPSASFAASSPARPAPPTASSPTASSPVTSSPAAALAGAELTAVPVVAGQGLTTPKSASGRLARTDTGLLARTDDETVSVVVKLDHDGAASYAGGVAGLDATSPAVTGVPLTGGTAAETAYAAYQSAREEQVSATLRAVAPAALVGQRLRTVYGGMAATIPAGAVEAVLAIDGVVAVQLDEERRLRTGSGPDTDADAAPAAAADPAPGSRPSTAADSTGAPTTAGGGRPGRPPAPASAGEGVLFGSLDSGVWPEHPSFADRGDLEPPPGPARRCDFGDNPLTPAADPFVCNDKLVGGATFLDTYLQDPDRAAREPFLTARDSDGHGTHTATTAAGGVVRDTEILGVPRANVAGVAPGAWVMAYKVCGVDTCMASDSVMGVGQAVADGVDVLSYSIDDGGRDPATDPVALAFLDAYAAGVLVAAAAGNDGPQPGTADHEAPWVTTVAAATGNLRYGSTLTLTAAAATTTFDGASVTRGTPGTAPLPVVLAASAPYASPRCDTPAPPRLFTGKVVVCERGDNERVDKGFNVLQGGAAAMVLHNPVAAEAEADTHWLPTVHLPDGAGFLAFLAEHPDTLASFPAGAARPGRADVMAASSSRGPAGLFTKPDLTGAGVQVLAGDSPVSRHPSSGPPGEYFQVSDGTSMAAPHVAGAAVLARAAHPGWTPGQVRSALATTAVTDVVRPDGQTPADPFDMGSGRVDAGYAGRAALTLDETATRFAALGADPVSAVDLNLPSINAPVMPGRVTTTRTLRNTTGRTLVVRASATAPPRSWVEVTPRTATVRVGQSVTLTVTIASRAPVGEQQFGSVLVEPTGADAPALHLPIAFVRAQGSVRLAQQCTPSTVGLREGDTSTCTVQALNTATEEATVDLDSTVGRQLRVTGANGADVVVRGHVRRHGVTLTGARPPVPSVAPGSTPAGYVPLDALGIAVRPVGDEELIVFTGLPPFVYDGQTWTGMTVSSNGFVVVGDTPPPDAACCELPAGPDPAPPDNVLAPFWTDLDGTGAPGVLVGIVSGGGRSWLVVEHRLDVFGTRSRRTFQTWVGLGSVQDISYAYPPGQLPADPLGQPFLVGAENGSGAGDMEAVLPTGDLVVGATDPVPGGSASYSFTVVGRAGGDGRVRSELRTDAVPGVTVVRSTVSVLRRR